MTDRKKVVLIVDDDPDWIEFTKIVLLKIGDLSVISAHNGEIGLEKAAAEVPDLIILDVMMPKKDGFNVFYELRANPKTKEIPVIMLTGVSEKSGIKFSEKDMKEFIGEKPLEFIDKPVDPQKLEEAAKKALKI